MSDRNVSRSASVGGLMLKQPTLAERYLIEVPRLIGYKGFVGKAGRSR